MGNNFFKNVYRKLYSLGKSFWLSNIIRTSYVAWCQGKHLKTSRNVNAKKLIIFLTPGVDRTNGGIISILSLANETEHIYKDQDVGVFICSFPSDPPLLKYTGIPDNRIIFDLAKVIESYGSQLDVLIHIPEFYVARFLKHCTVITGRYEHNYKFNIMLQNIKRVPTRNDVTNLASLGPTTVTTAHTAYSGVDTEIALGCPVHHLSVWISPENYKKKMHSEKEDIFVLSPDLCQDRDRVVERLKSALPGFEFITIKNMTYTEYKNIVSRTKYALTFGEGLDGYYIETIFSGGIGCAVYNEEFFTEDFKSAPFIYKSWEELINRLPDDLKLTEDVEEYNRINSITYELLSKQYSYNNYKMNLLSFYKKYFFYKYT